MYSNKYFTFSQTENINHNYIHIDIDKCIKKYDYEIFGDDNTYLSGSVTTNNYSILSFKYNKEQTYFIKIVFKKNIFDKNENNIFFKFIESIEKLNQVEYDNSNIENIKMQIQRLEKNKRSLFREDSHYKMIDELTNSTYESSDESSNELTDQLPNKLTNIKDILNDGLNDGSDDGLNDGSDDGLNDGSDHGLNDGSDHGLNDGSDNGSKVEMDNGINDRSDNGSDNESGGESDNGSHDGSNHQLNN